MKRYAAVGLDLIPFHVEQIGSALELQLQRAWNGFIGVPQQARVIAVASDEVDLRPADIAEAINAIASDEARD